MCIRLIAFKGCLNIFFINWKLLYKSPFRPAPIPHKTVFSENSVHAFHFTPHIKWVLSDMGQVSAFWLVWGTVGLSIRRLAVGLCRGFCGERRPLVVKLGFYPIKRVILTGTANCGTPDRHIKNRCCVVDTCVKQTNTFGIRRGYRPRGQS